FVLRDLVGVLAGCGPHGQRQRQAHGGEPGESQAFHGEPPDRTERVTSNQLGDRYSTRKPPLSQQTVLLARFTGAICSECPQSMCCGLYGSSIVGTQGERKGSIFSSTRPRTNRQIRNSFSKAPSSSSQTKSSP